MTDYLVPKSALTIHEINAHREVYVKINYNNCTETLSIPVDLQLVIQPENPIQPENMI